MTCLKRYFDETGPTIYWTIGNGFGFGTQEGASLFKRHNRIDVAMTTGKDLDFFEDRNITVESYLRAMLADVVLQNCSYTLEKEA